MGNSPLHTKKFTPLSGNFTTMQWKVHYHTVEAHYHTVLCLPPHSGRLTTTQYKVHHHTVWGSPHCGRFITFTTIWWKVHHILEGSPPCSHTLTLTHIISTATATFKTIVRKLRPCRLKLIFDFWKGSKKRFPKKYFSHFLPIFSNNH